MTHFTKSVRSVSLLLLALLYGCASIERAPPQFKVGDIVIARNFTRHPELNGTEVRVSGDFRWRWVKGYDTLRCYAVTTVDGQELAAQSFQLQRRADDGYTAATSSDLP